MALKELSKAGFVNVDHLLAHLFGIHHLFLSLRLGQPGFSLKYKLGEALVKKIFCIAKYSPLNKKIFYQWISNS